MININQVTLSGNLTRDIEIRCTPNGAVLGVLGLAVNRKYKKGDQWVDDPLFIDVTIWGRQAEDLADTALKGSPIIVNGYLRLDQWKDKEGKPVSKISVTANNAAMLLRDGMGPGYSNRQPTTYGQPAPQPPSGYQPPAQQGYGKPAPPPFPVPAPRRPQYSGQQDTGPEYRNVTSAPPPPPRQPELPNVNPVMDVSDESIDDIPF